MTAMTILTSLGELPLILTGCMSSQTIIIITFRWEFSLKCHPSLPPTPPPTNEHPLGGGGVRRDRWHFTLVRIPPFRNSRENGYKLWVQWFLGSYGWTSVTCDWSIVIKATINQSKVTLVHQDPRNLCTENFYPFSLKFSLLVIK